MIDYLEGKAYVGEFIQSHASEPLFAPTPALHETVIGAVRTRGDDGLEQARSDLGWVEPVSLTVDGAAEAARIDSELHSAGEPIGPLDTLIAGVVREAGGTVVTRDEHFERVDDLDVALIGSR
ncbi:type II toxin-antitoxin system VapC family toxin [Salinadaptatus halalkaliphilus]|uniref:type II toxin-antitoxin system VapC family toxin n=1 Tax=Salinadaptatus halalkaliphilus TaxID=2419781 RepID=UPI001C2C9391|nr:type II toxin-antitoxin system VapC family toxin [Salinadaptatus halalkaliphilus]